MLNTGFSPWPSFSEAEAGIARDVLLSNRVNYWTGGEGRAFEREFAHWCGTGHAVAVANGTAALELAWKALGIGPGDEVVVTPRTFIACASSIVNAGAVPVFADVDADTQNITAQSVEPVLTSRTRAILAVHLAGWPCEMNALRDLSKIRNFLLVEDCAQAHGARYYGRSVGGLGDIAAWSFCQDKIITTAGEGGTVTTDNDDLWAAAWSVKDHGKCFDAVYNREHPQGFRWLHERIGTNWRLPEIQAAIGRFQLGRLVDWHSQRAANAEAILKACAVHGVFRVPQVPDHIEHAWYRAYAFVQPEALKPGWSRDRIIAEINALGIPCSVGSCPEVYLEKALAAYRPHARLPVARQLGETSIAFLVHPTLTPAEIDRTCDAIQAVARQATR